MVIENESMRKSNVVGYSLAYDECYSYNPVGDWTSSHQMLVNGKTRDISDEDLVACAKEANLSERNARAVIAEVREIVANWRAFAATAEVAEDFTDKIETMLKKELI